MLLKFTNNLSIANDTYTTVPEAQDVNVPVAKIKELASHKQDHLQTSLE